jgi:hypothetical protein
MTRSFFSSVLLSISLLTLSAHAAEREVSVLEDPAGDDLGSGTLTYPQRAGFTRGDLDLRALQIYRSDNVYRFEATFAKPIGNPASVAGDVGPEPLSYFARNGFYEFNLDIYIDQDRIKGAGNTYALPGRNVSIDESYAWEKAVILTPRPELMRKQLINAVAESEHATNDDDVAKRIDASILFVTDVQVRGRTIAFTVPAAFLSAVRPDTDWAITAFVTGAQTSTPANINLPGTTSDPLTRLTLGVMQPRQGQPRDTFGYSGNRMPTPIVDLLAPPPLKQTELLSGSPALVGVSWTASGATLATGSGMTVKRLTTKSSPTSNASQNASQDLGAPASMQATPATSGIERGDIAERLRKLNQLRSEQLISEAEYQELRRKILSEL